MEVEHVNAHHTKEELQQVSLFERFIAEGTEKTAELATDAAMMEGGLNGTGKSEHDPTGRRRSLCIIAICSLLSLSGGRMERL